MEIYITPRRGGKTTYLLEKSNQTGATIVCINSQTVEWLVELSKRVGKPIPKPMTYEEAIKEGRYRKLDFLLDDTERFLQETFRLGKIEVAAFNVGEDGGDSHTLTVKTAPLPYVKDYGYISENKKETTN